MVSQRIKHADFSDLMTFSVLSSAKRAIFLFLFFSKISKSV